MFNILEMTSEIYENLVPLWYNELCPLCSNKCMTILLELNNTLTFVEKIIILWLLVCLISYCNKKTGFVWVCVVIRLWAGKRGNWCPVPGMEFADILKNYSTFISGSGRIFCSWISEFSARLLWDPWVLLITRFFFFFLYGGRSALDWS
jgi:hypothetical protein